MFNVYIAPQSPTRHETVGIMYDIASYIVKEFENDDIIKADMPAFDYSQKSVKVPPVKFDNIRDAKSKGCDLYISLQESNESTKAGCMGIYCSKINKASKELANSLDSRLEHLLFVDNIHVKECTTDMAITQFERKIPSIVFYINHDNDNQIVTDRIKNNIHSVAKVFITVIRQYFEHIIEENEKLSKPYIRGDRFLLDVPSGEVRAFSKLNVAVAKGSHDHILGNGYYIVYDWSSGCYNLSSNVHIPGVWVREEDLGLE